MHLTLRLSVLLRAFTWVPLGLIAAPAGAMVVINDHFDDGTLDP